MFIRKINNSTEYRNENLDLHRINHPAITTPNGGKHYFQYNLIHREDGPATIWMDPFKEEYWLYNTQIQKEDLHAPLNYLKLKYDIDEVSIQTIHSQLCS